ncbi:nudix hydrolase 13, mitochondrial-like [Phragmites australis]|uniref:nudix hydrolase 13, mitochondrial-like n=1 Tax=Phragmites australis TaxID=29695 RepID=UPI002D7A11EB|nr:nudix hydrolase 13, mitochondrial-like [Phragmites australis]XP_062184941.1 nudix hydrolase 13, mitochondrial-like [Phragmites australis]
MASEKKILVARKGRLRQRYDNEYRLVAGCVPYRVRTDGQPEVLMVSAPNRNDLVFPKGGWEDDEDVYQAACREALEEAGVKGTINKTALGLWVFRSKSSPVDSDSPRGACKGYIFALEVEEELEQWPEQDTHGRQWVSPADAYRLCRYDWMREALSALMDRLPAISHYQPAAKVKPAPELNEHGGVYMMVKAEATADRAVALC